MVKFMLVNNVYSSFHKIHHILNNPIINQRHFEHVVHSVLHSIIVVQSFLENFSNGKHSQTTSSKSSSERVKLKPLKMSGCKFLRASGSASDSVVLFSVKVGSKLLISVEDCWKKEP